MALTWINTALSKARGRTLAVVQGLPDRGGTATSAMIDQVATLLKADLTHLWSHPRILRVDFLSLKKLPQPGEFNDLFSGQDGAHRRLLLSGVNLIQMMLK